MTLVYKHDIEPNAKFKIVNKNKTIKNKMVVRDETLYKQINTHSMP